LFDQIGELAAGEGEVDRHVDEPRLLHPEPEQEIRIAVLAECRDAIALDQT
jgi:hypothetical protein